MEKKPSIPMIFYPPKAPFQKAEFWAFFHHILCRIGEKCLFFQKSAPF